MCRSPHVSLSFSFVTLTIAHEAGSVAVSSAKLMLVVSCGCGTLLSLFVEATQWQLSCRTGYNSVSASNSSIHPSIPVSPLRCCLLVVLLPVLAQITDFMNKFRKCAHNLFICTAAISLYTIDEPTSWSTSSHPVSFSSRSTPLAAAPLPVICWGVITWDQIRGSRSPNDQRDEKKLIAFS